MMRIDCYSKVYGMPNVESEKWLEKEGYKKVIIKHLFNM